MSISIRSRTRSSQPTTPGRTRNRRRAAAALGLARGSLLGASASRTGRRSAAAASRPPGPCGRPRAPRACSSRDRRGPSASSRAAASRVVGEALHLAVRRVRPGLLEPGDARALVPGDAPASGGRRGCRFSNACGAPGDVRVLEAQDERAAGVPREQEVEQRRARGADVERPGGAGRDADADVGGHGPDCRRRLDRALSRRAAPGPCGTGPGRRRPGSTRISAAGRRPSVARPRGPVERQRVERLASAARIVTCAPGRQRPRLEVRQQARVLLGLLGDPAGPSPSSPTPSRRAAIAGRPPAGGLEVDRVAVRARLRDGPAARRAWPRRAARARPGGASPRRRSRPRSGPTTRRQQPLEQRVAAEDRVGGGAAGGGQRRGRGPSPAPRGRRRRGAGTSRSRPGWSRRRGARAAAVVATRPSEPITRRASRYSWAAAEMSAGSVRRMRPSECRPAAPTAVGGGPARAVRGAQPPDAIAPATTRRGTPTVTATPSSVARPVPRGLRADGRGRPRPGTARRRARRASRTRRRPRRAARRTGRRSPAAWTASDSSGDRLGARGRELGAAGRRRRSASRWRSRSAASRAARSAAASASRAAARARAGSRATARRATASRSGSGSAVAAGGRVGATRRRAPVRAAAAAPRRRPRVSRVVGPGRARPSRRVARRRWSSARCRSSASPARRRRRRPRSASPVGRVRAGATPADARRRPGRSARRRPRARGPGPGTRGRACAGRRTRAG